MTTQPNYWIKCWHTIYALRGPGGTYIGCTSRPLEVRFQEHLSNARSGSERFVHEAIREHGEAAFKIEPLELVFANRMGALDIEARVIAAAQARGERLFNSPNGPRAGRKRREFDQANASHAVLARGAR